MRSKITVVGEHGGELAAALGSGDRVDVVALDEPTADLAGSHVVVVTGGDVKAAAVAAARRAPAAVLLVSTEDREADCAVAVGASLFPRARVIGIAREDVPDAVEAVLFGREVDVRAAVPRRNEGVVEHRATIVPVRLGTGGVRRIQDAGG